MKGYVVDEISPAGGVDEPVRLVLDYLSSTERGELFQAKTHVAPTARLTFPGNQEFDSLEQWFTYFRSRMAWIRKRGHVVDQCPQDDGSVVVYVHGRLEGETVDGVTFNDVRFLDRFVVRDGQIHDQQVWNDLGVRGLDSAPI